MSDDDGSSSCRPRLDLAWQGLTELPEDVKGDERVVELDVSHNAFADGAEITLALPRLETLVLDANELHSHSAFTHLVALRTLSVNANHIESLPTFVDTVAAAFPRLAHLSMLRNAACPNFFVAGGSPRAYADYRLFVVSRVPSLVSLDGSPVTPEERAEAKRVYGTKAPRQRQHGHKASATPEKPKVHDAATSDVTLDDDDWTSDEDVDK
jgi:Leucine-rich repeat (LRR) protein